MLVTLNACDQAVMRPMPRLLESHESARSQAMLIEPEPVRRA